MSDRSVGQTLKFMGQTGDVRLTNELARQICQRAQATAVMEGSIAQIGNTYNVILNAVNCVTGETIATSSAEAADKDHVLAALGKATEEIRGKLGESLASIQKFNTPINEATTSSLEALKAYSLGLKVRSNQGESAAEPHMKQAVALDPNFAIAWAYLGQMQINQGLRVEGEANVKRAYELRDRASEQERFYIDSHYFQAVMGDADKATPVYEQWAQTYPNDALPQDNLAIQYFLMGKFDKALEHSLRGQQLDHTDSLEYVALGSIYHAMGRLDEAKATFNEAIAKGLGTSTLYRVRYALDFSLKDEAEMAKDLAQLDAAGPVNRMTASALRGDTEAYYGRIGKARELYESVAKELPPGQGRDLIAAGQSERAIVVALVGESAVARKMADASLAGQNEMVVRYNAALALALTGIRRAQNRSAMRWRRNSRRARL